MFLRAFVGTYAYTGHMDELMNLKYLTQNNGYWQYERRVPKAVLSHPYWGKKSHGNVHLVSKSEHLSKTCYLHGKSVTTSLRRHWRTSKTVIHTSWINVSVGVELKPISKCLISNPTMDRLKVSTTITSAVIMLITSTMSVSCLVHLMIMFTENKPIR